MLFVQNRRKVASILLFIYVIGVIKSTTQIKESSNIAVFEEI